MARSCHRRFAFLSALILLSALCWTAQARGASIGIQIEVYSIPPDFNYLFGTAVGGPDASSAVPLYTGNLSAPGREFRYVVSLDQSVALTAFSVQLTALDPTAIDYVMGSLTSLSGLNISPGSFSSLNDGSPGVATISASGAATSTRELFRLDYVVQEWIADVPVPIFGVVLSGLTSSGNTINADADTAVLTAVSVLPEPGSLLLVASGFSGIVALGKRRRGARQHRAAMRDHAPLR